MRARFECTGPVNYPGVAPVEAAVVSQLLMRWKKGPEPAYVYQPRPCLHQPRPCLHVTYPVYKSPQVAMATIQVSGYKSRNTHTILMTAKHNPPIFLWFFCFFVLFPVFGNTQNQSHSASAPGPGRQAQLALGLFACAQTWRPRFRERTSPAASDERPMSSARCASAAPCSRRIARGSMPMSWLKS